MARRDVLSASRVQTFSALETEVSMSKINRNELNTAALVDVEERRKADKKRQADKRLAAILTGFNPPRTNPFGPSGVSTAPDSSRTRLPRRNFTGLIDKLLTRKTFGQGTIVCDWEILKPEREGCVKIYPAHL